MWLSLLCHNVEELSLSIAFTISTQVDVVVQYRPQHLLPRATTKEPLMSFYFPSPLVLIYPSSSKKPKEIRCRQTSGACFVLFKTSLVPILVSTQTVPIPMPHPGLPPRRNRRLLHFEGLRLASYFHVITFISWKLRKNLKLLLSLLGGLHRPIHTQNIYSYRVYIEPSYRKVTQSSTFIAHTYIRIWNKVSMIVSCHTI